MKIAYGIHGYGRGHATRAHGLIQCLGNHEITVIAGGDAIRFLTSAGYKAESVPSIGYRYRKGASKYSRLLTIAANAPLFIDLFLGGRVFKKVISILKERQIDLVISDSEPWTQRAANALGIPLVSFDHYAIFVYCSMELTRAENFQRFMTSLVYRAYMGKPQTIIASAFFSAKPMRNGVHLVGPIVRPMVKKITPTRGNHLLVYFVNAEQFFSDRVVSILQNCGCEILVYGKGDCPPNGRITFRAIDPVRFIEDLASCRAVISSGGNQLVGETIWLRKPILAIPENTVDQRLNAREITRLKVGMQTTIEAFSAECVKEFLDKEDVFRAQCELHARDATAEVAQIIERVIPRN